MQLWNDYEGKTIAGIYPIEALLLTEGRNACFATHDRAGRPAVLRLTEALNDQGEMSARYEAIRRVGQRNLVSIEDFGDVEMDGEPLIYLVMEATQENLAEIVCDRRLSIEETGEVALSLTTALEALHAHGLVHGHVELASVLAAGQVVKLRSDCIRLAPEGAEGERARAEDVFGLADVLNRALTQQHLEDASDALALPEPYAAIVRNVVRGSWGLEQVATELRRFVRPATPPQPSPTQLASPDPHDSQLEPSLAGRSAGADPGLLLTRKPPASDPQLLLAYAEAQQGNAEAAPVSAGGAGEPWANPHPVARGAGRALWLAGAVGVLLLLFVAWHVTARGNKASAAPVVSAAPAIRTAPAASPASPVGPPAAVLPAPVVANTHADAAPAHGDVWRVVAYTYNVEAQAQAKAKLIAERNAGLAPQVFSRTGHAPFLVTLGGPLTRPQAATMLQQARSRGLARDVYMQNYSH